jgi:hypothetical protein
VQQNQDHEDEAHDDEHDREGEDHYCVTRPSVPSAPLGRELWAC